VSVDKKKSERAAKMGNIGAIIVIGIVKTITFFYTILTLPIYWLIQQPWKVRRESRKLKVIEQRGNFELKVKEFKP
jgi:hypothetical protein